jgi:hypothetical protein
MRAEIERRTRSCRKVLEFLRAHPQQWIAAQDFMALGGAMAWRTRLSDARKVIEAEGGKLQNRQWRANAIEGQPATRLMLGPIVSEYRYLPSAPLGRDASVPSVQPELIPVRY